MALQSNEDLRLLNGLLPLVSSLDLSFQFLIFNLSISVCEKFRHLFLTNRKSRSQKRNIF